MRKHTALPFNQYNLSTNFRAPSTTFSGIHQIPRVKKYRSSLFCSMQNIILQPGNIYDSTLHQTMSGSCIMDPLFLKIKKGEDEQTIIFFCLVAPSFPQSILCLPLFLALFARRLRLNHAYNHAALINRLYCASALGNCYIWPAR